MRLLRTISLCLAACAGLAVSLAAEEAKQTAAAIVKDSGWNRGMCVDISADPKLAIALAKASKLGIYRVERDAAAAGRTRKLLEAAGLSPLRVRVEVGPLEKLAYPDSCANLIIAPGATKEVLRLLRPAGGVAYLRAGASAPKGFKSGRGPGGLSRLERLPLAGAGDWTHNGYDATNNRYSPDTHIKPPFRIKWYGNPIRTLGTLWTVRGLAAKGRYFMVDLSPEHPDRAWITARDAYNGVVLWEREAGGTRFSWFKPFKKEKPTWTMRMNQPGKVHPTQMIVVGGKIYLTDGPRLMVIDAVTGKDLTSITAPAPSHPKNQWTYVAHADGKLYGHVAAAYKADYKKGIYWSHKVTRSKAGGPATVFALDLKNGGKTLWVRGGNGEKELGQDFSQPLAIGAGRVFLRSGKDLHMLDAASGKTVKVIRGVDGPKENTFWNGTVVGEKLHLYRYGLRFYGRRPVLPWPIFSTVDGKRLGEERSTRNKMAFFSSAEKVCRPPSGGNGCPLGSGAGKVMFERNSYYREGGGSRSYGSYRAGCRVPALPANGVVHFLPAFGCTCRVFSATITLDPGKTDEKLDTAPPPLLEKGAASSGAATAAIKADDWPVYRGNTARTAVTDQDISRPARKLWEKKIGGQLTPPIAVGDLVFFGSMDERVRALEAKGGKLCWTFYATGPVSAAPVYSKGRIYFGAHDGWVYCLAAANGKLVWRFRAAPFARKQSAFGRLISAWPVRQGLAVSDGTVYFTCGRVPNQGVITYAVDAASGRMLWRRPLLQVIPGGSIVVGKDRIFVPAEVWSTFIQLSRKDGSIIKIGNGRGRGVFEHMSYVRGSADDDAKFRKGFIVHGSSFVGHGHPKKAKPGGFAHDLYAAPWKESLGKSRWASIKSFGDGGLFMPLFGGKRVYFRFKLKLASIDRSKLTKLRTTRKPSKWSRVFPREKLLAWKAGDLPCGIPEWGLLARDTVLTGGPEGVTAINAADGKPRWNVKLPGSTNPAAISRGRVFLTSRDGTVRCLGK